MTISIEDVLALEAMDIKIRAMIPSSYNDAYDDVVSVSMSSAPLKYGKDGQVAWNEIWGSFCDLAMAGGPPHRGTLLEPGSETDIAAAPDEYDRVVTEICRGLTLVTGLPVRHSSPGWVGVECRSPGMAAWLVRAIVMENVLATYKRQTLYLPAGPAFLLAKEIKNVITSMAKTCHYWNDHMDPAQQQTLESMIGNPTSETELLEPASLSDIQHDPVAYRQELESIARAIGQEVGLPCFAHRYYGWIGIECPNVQSAIWLMRAMIVENILARREGECLFLPVSIKAAVAKPSGRLIRTFASAYRLCKIKKLTT